MIIIQYHNENEEFKFLKPERLELYLKLLRIDWSLLLVVGDVCLQKYLPNAFLVVSDYPLQPLLELYHNIKYTLPLMVAFTQINIAAQLNLLLQLL